MSNYNITSAIPTEGQDDKDVMYRTDNSRPKGGNNSIETAASKQPGIHFNKSMEYYNKIIQPYIGCDDFQEDPPAGFKATGDEVFKRAFRSAADDSLNTNTPKYGQNEPKYEKCYGKYYVRGFQTDLFDSDDHKDVAYACQRGHWDMGEPATGIQTGKGLYFDHLLMCNPKVNYKNGSTTDKGLYSYGWLGSATSKELQDFCLDGQNSDLDKYITGVDKVFGQKRSTKLTKQGICDKDIEFFCTNRRNHKICKQWCNEHDSNWCSTSLQTYCDADASRYWSDGECANTCSTKSKGGKDEKILDTCIKKKIDYCKIGDNIVKDKYCKSECPVALGINNDSSTIAGNCRAVWQKYCGTGNNILKPECTGTNGAGGFCTQNAENTICKTILMEKCRDRSISHDLSGNLRDLCSCYLPSDSKEYTENNNKLRLAVGDTAYERLVVKPECYFDQCKNNANTWAKSKECKSFICINTTKLSAGGNINAPIILNQKGECKNVYDEYNNTNCAKDDSDCESKGGLCIDGKCDFSCTVDDDCNGGGSCVSNVCVCKPKYDGEMCQIDKCEGCSVHGDCDDTGKCVCRIDEGKQWYGDKCTISSDPCEYVICGRGKCENGVCNCADTGNIGSECEIPKCSPTNVCQNNGTCKNNGECDCVNGFSGLNCEIDSCESVFCSNGGTCEGGICKCINNFSGEDCSVDACDNINCSGKGTCEYGLCTCLENFSGDTCEIDMCDKVNCQNGGECVNGECKCSDEFTGSMCETPLDKCFAITCEDGKECVDGVCESKGLSTGIIILIVILVLALIGGLSYYFFFHGK
jgi:hypothetical protein